MLEPAWEAVLAEDPEVAGLFGADGPEIGSWLMSCRESLERYFTLEDPRRLEPAEREMYVETVLDSKLLLRGFVDRLDVAPTGEVRVVDYKTGRSPGEWFEAKALFQMKFYALVLWRTRGRIPTMLQLIYLGNGEVLRYSPDERDLLAVERKVDAIWKAIARAAESGDWRPNRTALCAWCSHQALCPEFGGTPPPLPVVSEADVADPGLSADGTD
jgi:putative RecB family exonuclease